MQVAFINKEEKLFGWDESQYPAITVLEEECGPFDSLFTSAYSWQKTLRKWLEGLSNLLSVSSMEYVLIKA